MPTRRQMFSHPFPWMLDPESGKGSEHSDSIPIRNNHKEFSGTLIGYYEFDPINEDLRVVLVGYCYSCVVMGGIYPLKFSQVIK